MAEPLIPIAQAAALFPKRDGRKVSVKAIVRRIRGGHQGVRLRAVRDGGRWYTTAEWVEEFQAAVTRTAVPDVRSPAEVTRAVAAARAFFASRGCRPRAGVGESMSPGR